MLPLDLRALAREAFATAFLLMAIVGSGIMGDRLSGGNVAIALLANSIATGAALIALILTFNAHMNPLVSFVAALDGMLSWPAAAAYAGVQVVAGASGVMLANLMYGLPVATASQHARNGAPLLLSEVVATFGLLMVVASVSRRSPASVPVAVGTYIAAAYWFTSSTSFANPAVSLARSLTNTFTGIRPADVPLFVTAQIIGATLALVVDRGLLKE